MEEKTIPETEETDAELIAAPSEITEKTESLPTVEEEAPKPEADFEAMAAKDLLAIKALAPEFREVEHLCELPFAQRFAELRELGLSVREALYATMPTHSRESGKSHLRGTVPRGKSSLFDSLSVSEMKQAKDLFYGLSEAEINSLYRRVRGG